MDIAYLMQQNNGLEFLPAFIISLALGLLIGLERERSPAAKAGLRTFALVALLGTLLAMIGQQAGVPWLLAAGFIGVAAIIIAAYVGDDVEDDPGTTTQAALMLCYGLGIMVWYGYSTLAIMLAIVTTVLLHFKPELQSMSKSLTRQDVRSILQFAVLSFIVLPILPNVDYGPNDTLNPYQTWLMVVLISGVSLAGYVALRFIGKRYGAPLLGFFGGMASSTATTLVYARYGRDGAMVGLATVVILIANLVVMLRLGMVSAIVAPGMFLALLPVLLSGLTLGVIVTFLWWRRMSEVGELPMPQVKNPTEIKTAVSFGLLYALLLLASAWLSEIAGTRGLYLLALASGLTDVDAVALSTMRLFQQGKVNAGDAVLAVSLALISNLAFKFGLVLAIGGKALARQIAPAALAITVGVFGALLLMH